jgi:hypothetical protein
VVADRLPQTVLAMPSRISSLPPGFSWLLPACRPTRKEVDAYAHAIARAEGYPPELEKRLHNEAELQLWIWRTENRRASRRRIAAAFTDSPGFVTSH